MPRIPKRYALFGIAAAGLLCATTAFAAPAPTVTVPTVRMLPNATRNAAGTPAADKVLYVSLALTVPDQKALDAFTASQQDPKSPNYRQWLTPAQFGARFGHSDSDIQIIKNYAAANGLTVDHAWSNHLFVTLKGTVAQFAQAMNIQFVGYNRSFTAADDAEPTCFAPDRDPSFPTAVGSLLRGVYGLSTAIREVAGHQQTLNASPTKDKPGPGAIPTFNGKAPAFNGAQPGANKIAGLSNHPHAAWPGPATPAQLSHVYQNDLIHNWGYFGDNMTVGVYSPTNFTASDLTGFCTTYGITGYTLVEKKVDGGATDSNGALEACLDCETIIGQSPHCQVVMYEGPNTVANADLWNAMANDNVPVVSCSWGLWEDYYHNYISGGDGYVAVQNTALQQMDTQGQSIFTATGDYGNQDPYTAVASIQFPSSSPYVTAVGGTGLPSQDGSFGWSGENGWSGSAGGYSIYYGQPSWQHGPGVPTSGLRMIPDISAMADPSNPGYSIYYGGALTAVGGTSGAAPLWSGNVILIDEFLFDFSFTQRRVGNIDADLYRIGTTMNTSTDIFTYHDITSGNNGYACTSFWDLVTGWGSANFHKLLCNEAFWCNLHPYSPFFFPPGGTAWNTPVIVHDNAGTSIEPMFYEDQGNYYIGMSGINDGPADAPANVTAATNYGGALSMVTMGPYESDSGPFVFGPLDYFATLNGGGYWHLNGSGYFLFGEKMDWYNSVGESAEYDNTFQKYVATTSNSTNAPTIASIQVSPGSVVGGNTVTGRVTLTANVTAAGGANVGVVAGDPTVVGVPLLVNIPQNSNTATFTVQTYGVASTVTETLYGHCAGVTVSTTLSVSKAIINNLTISASPVPGGTYPLVTVNLTGMAPPAGLTVTLNSTVPSAATVPASIFIPANYTSGGFYPTTYPQNTDTFTTIQGTAYGSTRSVGLIVQYPRISTVTWTANPVAGGSPTIATVTLTGPTTPAGLSVSLASSNFPIAQVPITFAFSGGATTASFLVTTHDPAVNTNVTVTLTTHGVNYPQTLTVNH